MNLRWNVRKGDGVLETRVCDERWRRGHKSRPRLLFQTYFRSMLKRVLSFELSSGFSDTYASGLEVVVVSVVDAMEVVGDGAGDTLVLLEVGSPEGELMSTGEW